MSKRIKYFIGHLICSVVAGLLLLTLVFLVWYPTPLAFAEGVTVIVLMLLVIDVILGPLLTLLVYKEGKKTLKLDLSIIIAVQVLAMSYGVYALAQSRPAWIVQSGWLFEAVSANAIDHQDQEKAVVNYQSNSMTGPKWVAVDDAKNSKNSLAAPQLMPSIYTDLFLAKVRVNRYALPLVDLKQFNEQAELEKTLKGYPQARSWMPLRTTGLGLVVLLDQSHQVIDIVNLRPWQE